jgi:hypothetical protein
MTPITESRARSLIEAHFSRRISPDNERRLRAHLSLCKACVKVYDAHLMFERITAGSPMVSGRERLGAALGFRVASSQRATTLWGLAAGFAAALAALAVLRVAGANHEGVKQETEFAARGGAHVGGGERGGRDAEAPRMLVYALGPTRELAPTDRMKASDQLAFAYTNPSGFRNLLIFGVDEHRHVYWYHPAWRSQNDHPRALGIESGPEARELPEAVRQDLDGRALTVYAVFLNEEIPVERVEELIANAQSPDEPLPLPGAYQQRIELGVERRP